MKSASSAAVEKTRRSGLISVDLPPEVAAECAAAHARCPSVPLSEIRAFVRDAARDAATAATLGSVGAIVQARILAAFATGPQLEIGGSA